MTIKESQLRLFIDNAYFIIIIFFQWSGNWRVPTSQCPSLSWKSHFSYKAYLRPAIFSYALTFPNSVSPSPLVLLSEAVAEEESALPKSTKLGQILVLQNMSSQHYQQTRAYVTWMILMH